MFNSSNPAIKKLGKGEAVGFGVSNPASYAGIGAKIGIYLALTIVSAILFVALIPSLLVKNPTLATALLIGCLVAALVSSFIASFRPHAAAVAGGVYCIAEGAVVGLVSSLFEVVVQGIIIMALLSTIFTLAVVALLYFTGIVRVGTKFRRFVLVALISLLLSELMFFVLSLFVPAVSYVLYNNFGLQIILSIVFIVIATLCMFTDFDNMTNIVENGLDKSYEWYAAFGLMVTLIWLYMEFLRLALILFANRD